VKEIDRAFFAIESDIMCIVWKKKDRKREVRRQHSYMACSANIQSIARLRNRLEIQRLRYSMKPSP
jgi:hypothetical protein